MTWLRNRIRRWLGVPTRADIRAIVLREIDADYAWLDRDDSKGTTLEASRRNHEINRITAIAFGYREDTRG